MDLLKLTFTILLNSIIRTYVITRARNCNTLKNIKKLSIN